MFPNNNDNYPRTPGGYSVETYEPAVIHPDQRQKAEDLVRMAFTEKRPIATITRFPTVVQQNIQPNPVINNFQYARVQNITPVIYNTPNPNINGIQLVNQNQNGIYRVNNIQNINPVPTVKSLNTDNKASPFVYQNLIQMNNAYQVRNNNAALPINTGNRVIVTNFNNQRPRPILRSNSAMNYSTPNFGARVIEKKIISGNNYKPHVYKRALY
jgi:hypothetical protein